MGKWFAGIAATIVGGSVLWFLTNAFYPHLFGKNDGPTLPPDIRVECTPTPSTIAPGGTTELTIKVTRNGIPIEGAAVKVDWGAKPGSQDTVSGGMLKVLWTAPNPSAGGYVFPVEANLAGVRTAQGELEGSARTNCEILVH
jgi:hypothetical protein